jgi:Domain of unknown function (DUF4440)
VQRAEAAFFDALLDGDVTALEAVLDQEFLIVDVASRSVHDRAAFLEAIGTGAVTFEEIETFAGETVFRPVGDARGSSSAGPRCPSAMPRAGSRRSAAAARTYSRRTVPAGSASRRREPESRAMRWRDEASHDPHGKQAISDDH